MQTRIIVLGNYGVGKTSLLRKLKTNVFNEHVQSSVGFDYFQIKCEKNGRDVILQFWDTAGQQKFATITQQYFHKADAVAIIVSAQSSNQDKIVQFRKYLEQYRKCNSQNPIVLITTKIDLSSKYEMNKIYDYNGELKKLVDQFNCTFPVSLSAKLSDKTQIISVFQEHLLTKIFNKIGTSMISVGQDSKIELRQVVIKKDGSNCC